LTFIERNKVAFLVVNKVFAIDYSKMMNLKDVTVDGSSNLAPPPLLLHSPSFAFFVIFCLSIQDIINPYEKSIYNVFRVEVRA